MDDQLRYYLRYHPHWYLILSRYPQEYNRLIQEYKDEKNQHFIDKIEQVSMLINMVEMMLQVELNELLDNLIKEIKCDQRYIDYLEAEKKLYIPENKSLLKTYQSKLDEYEELKKYEQYIDNTDIKEEIKKLKKQISQNSDIIDYYQKYHCLNDFLEEITSVVFKDISEELNLSPYRL